MKAKETVIIYLLSLLIISCKKNKSFKPDPIQPPEDRPAQKVFLPVKLESDKLAIYLKYQDNNLTEIENSDGYKSQITYKNDLPLKLRRFKYDKPMSFSEYNFSDVMKTKISSFDEDGNLLTPTGHRFLTKNAADQIMKISYFGADKKLFKEQTLTYSSFNPSAISTNDLVSSLTTNFSYSYDSKNGIFKSVKHTQLLFLETGYDFFNHAINNPLGYNSNTEKTTYTYKYNSENYPSELTIAKNNKSQTYKITYKEIK
ncbi:hypothetical protein [Pedobacter frigoris]|uniref:Uncharacterized protein n=1 Tax=Pedobacter frigoris TaxID=2571272 RepID=A0A4U1CCT9_9SPHI|nr:hypothetical protein [Pedobacter frigoris]TKC03959.1 hypothetical protein FA047_18625 [Pedobacter frigoris]